MKKLILALLLMALPFAAAHGNDIGLTYAQVFPVDPVLVVIYASVISGIAIIVALAFKDATEHHKQMLFWAISTPVAVATLYLAGTTVYLNFVSETGGPVHWHADYEVWVCGNQVKDMAESELWWENKVGTPTIHHHGDYRMHIEGVLLRKSEAALHNYFEIIGGSYDGVSFTYKASNGALRTFTNGEPCPNGLPGTWKLYVQSGEKHDRSWRIEPAGPEYVLAPFTNVPPGDLIRLVFETSEDELAMKQLIRGTE